MSDLAELFSDHRFRASSDGDLHLARLKREFGFREQWQVARLAIAVSLSLNDAPDQASNRDGTEIRGTTIFKRDGSGPAFAAMIVQHAERSLSVTEIGDLVEAHWNRGMTVLAERLDQAQIDDADPHSVILALAEESALQATGRQPDGAAGVELIEDTVVGQSAAKQIVIPLIREALEKEPVRLEATLLFTGPASTGKTLFADTIAAALRLPFVDSNGTIIRKVDELLEQIEATCAAEAGTKKEKVGERGAKPVYLYPPAVVVIDECHALPKGTQTELLTATEPSKREAKTSGEIADLRQVTFLLATTDANKLLEPLRTRARTVSLEPYKKAEIAEIVRRDNPSWPRTVHERLAMAGRLIPRQAKSQAEDFARYLSQEHEGRRASEELVLSFMRSRDMDSAGMIPRDYRLLSLLPKDQSPMGLQAISSQMGVEEAEIEETVEPFLIALGMMQREPRGRRITDKGLELISERDA